MPLEVAPTDIPDVLLVRSEVLRDARGGFLETFKQSVLAAQGADVRVAQVSESISQAKVLRGLHYQLEPHAQGKLVRVLRGAVMDVAIDVRRGSPWFGQHVAIELSAENRQLLWIPPGFAHGFCALEDDTHFLYMQTAEYAPDAEAGINPFDPEIGLRWPFPHDDMTLSNKDLELPALSSALLNFDYRGRSRDQTARNPPSPTSS